MYPLLSSVFSKATASGTFHNASTTAPLTSPQEHRLEEDYLGDDDGGDSEGGSSASKKRMSYMDIEGLPDSRDVSVEEGLAMTLRILCHGNTQREVSDRFQHSTGTVHYWFKTVLRALKAFALTVVKPVDRGAVQPEILANSRWYPFFKKCIGAIDGTHVAAWAPASKQKSFRGRKAVLVTQNVMAVCSHDMMFTFVYTGWEGTANDSRVFYDAIVRPENKFPMPSDEYIMSFFKVVRHPERPYLHIPNAAYRRYLHSQPPTYDINLFLRPDLRYVVGLREINHELFITQGWATIQHHVDIGLKYVLVFKIQDPRNWSVTILGDNCVNIDLRHIAPNYAILVHWSDEDDDVDDVVAPPPAPAEAGQPIFPDPPAEAAHPEPPAEAAHPQPPAGAAHPCQPNLDDQPNDVHIAPVTTFFQIVRINKSIAYKVPPKLAALADLEETMLLTIKVEDQEVYVA
ncbi:hypothetical protein SSX86_010644 [Deinandra increscens subsp. villosa]|uniref:Transposase n=1 Tax=Deinandra increscens subsp. villosa TaxID=3103831 RepID=A0AAP0H2K1_9ASTR